jgi:hypothetical protein
MSGFAWQKALPLTRSMHQFLLIIFWALNKKSYAIKHALWYQSLRLIIFSMCVTLGGYLVKLFQWVGLDCTHDASEYLIHVKAVKYIEFLTANVLLFPGRLLWTSSWSRSPVHGCQAPKRPHVHNLHQESCEWPGQFARQFTTSRGPFTDSFTTFGGCHRQTSHHPLTDPKVSVIRPFTPAHPASKPQVCYPPSPPSGRCVAHSRATTTHHQRWLCRTNGLHKSQNKHVVVNQKRSGWISRGEHARSIVSLLTASATHLQRHPHSSSCQFNPQTTV